jgi:Tfp pilus assembly protein PilV
MNRKTLTSDWTLLEQSMNVKLQKRSIRGKAFSLVEVVLAMGIFLMTVLALVGMLGPALKSVSTVEETDEVASVVDTVNAFLNSSPYIDKADPNDSRFEAIYNAIKNDGDYAVLFVYRWYDTDNNIVRQEIGFENNQNGNVHVRSRVNANRGGGIPAASFDSATSSIYRVILTASSAMVSDPGSLVSVGTEGSYPRYKLNQAFDAYSGNYLALEVRIFAEDPSSFNPAAEIPTNLANLANEAPLFTYDTAILRN